jgi:hypothetical protein
LMPSKVLLFSLSCSRSRACCLYAITPCWARLVRI